MNKKSNNKKLTAFERETERRRREMVNGFGGRVGRVPNSRVRMEAAHGASRSWLRLLLPDRKPEVRA